MISKLKALFELPKNASTDSIEHSMHMAAAALLIETARADFTQDADEQDAMAALLSSSLNLTMSEVKFLVEQASERVDNSTSLYEFTRIINDHYSAEQKLQLIDSMWGVAYADDNLDKYEEHLIRQVAELT